MFVSSYIYIFEFDC